jgi:hypothetical protein
MLRACMTAGVEVVMSEIPGRPRLDQFTAPDATHTASSDERGQGAAEFGDAQARTYGNGSACVDSLSS